VDEICPKFEYWLLQRFVSTCITATILAVSCEELLLHNSLNIVLQQ
jgi:hypothetical protein